MSAATGEPRLTPMMQRYLEVKAETPGTLLLFRMGDFYELFYEDAEIAAKILGLTLTSRDKGSSNPVPMAGFPYHALDGYLRKLIHAGHRAAICEQVEDPKQAKGLVRREVTQIVTPGTLTDESLLDPRENNFLAAVFPARDQIGLAWLELSTGRFHCATLEARPVGIATGNSALADSAAWSPLFEELARIAPSECLVPESALKDDLVVRLAELDSLTTTTRPPWSFSPKAAVSVLLRHFEVHSLEGFGIEDADGPATVAAGALLEYVQETQKASLGHITRLEPYHRGKSLLIDEATRRSLELTRTQRDGRREGSLLGVLDETVTPMGARLLAEWLSNPLTDRIAIERRLNAVEELTRETRFCRDLRDQLRQAYDLSRLASRVATLRASPRDLGSLSATLALLPRLKALLAGRQSDLLKSLDARLDLCAESRAAIEAALADDPLLNLADGGVIRSGFHATLDELRDLARGGKQWIAEYQAAEMARTGISSLKVGFNKVFGYYLEVTAANRDKVPDDYIRKQTLKNQERYITPQLKEYEEKVLSAQDRALALEQELFSNLREQVSRDCHRLVQTADVLARLDVLASLATVATARHYVRPEITDQPVLELRESRHPVLDCLQPSGEFVPNDVRIGVPDEVPIAATDGAGETDRKPGETQPHSGATIALLTGPNMAGKSTYIRQAALLTILGQMGSFVPAAKAIIGIADRVFARVGASDELGRGQSTFMVEMTETARILNTATRRSLVILDEIGRGTSTYDGISLAWAIAEFLHDHIRCRTLFATHYHELTQLPKTLSRCMNLNVAVHESEGDIVFLHRIVPGAADRSYGIHVARLAGVPRDVITRADRILEQLESDHQDAHGRPTIPERPGRRDRQLTLFEPPPHPVLDELKQLALDEMTPLQAMQELHRMRERLRTETTADQS